MLDLRAQVVNNDVNFYLDVPESTEPLWVGTISLSDSLTAISAKTKVLLKGVMNMAEDDKVPYAISDVFDEKGHLKNIKLIKQSNVWKWHWTSSNGIKRQQNFDPLHGRAYIEFYTMTVLSAGKIPEDSITALVIRGIITTMVKEASLK